MDIASAVRSPNISVMSSQPRVQPTTIYDIPQEVMVKIFCYLEVEDIIYIVQHVCQIWRAIARDEDLWNSLVYSPDHNRKESQIAVIIKQAPMLRNFLPRTETEPDLIVRTLIQYCHCIRRLRCDNWPRISVPQLRMVVQHYTNLTYLHVKFLGKDARSVLEILGGCAKLKTLSIEGESHTIPGALLPIANGCPLLERFHVQGSMVFSSDDFVNLLAAKRNRILSIHLNFVPNLYPVIQALGRCEKLEDVLLIEDHQEPYVNLRPLQRLRTLRSLTVFFKIGDGRNLFDLAQNVCWPNLEKLILYFGNEPYDVNKVQRIFHNFPNIKELIITGQHPNVANISDALINISRLADLQYLDISNCRTLTDDGIKHLSNCNNLKYLNVSWCRCLTDDTIEHLCKCRWLESLIMNACNITGNNFNLIMEYFDSLKLLSLKSCKKLNQSSVKLLIEQKPRLEVEMYY